MNVLNVQLLDCTRTVILRTLVSKRIRGEFQYRKCGKDKRIDYIHPNLGEKKRSF